MYGLPHPKDTKYQSSEIRWAFSILSSPHDCVVFPVFEGAMRVTPEPSMSRAAP